ncbi:toprim domain-containing protein [Candidatus Parcubacteria bacterium]|nr:toprim domain-containing protein [Candidatus Parcubacteria bacterium]
MDKAKKAAEYFMKLPGIGPRQARRFVYFLLAQDERFLDGLAETLKSLKQSAKQCISCMRFFEGRNEFCDTCASPSTDHSSMMVVEKDVDLENVQKTGAWRGRYFVLGGLLPILEKNPAEKIRIKALVTEVGKQQSGKLKEVVIALSANVEGDNTATFVKETLKPLVEKHGLTVTVLGRGFSTGTELEYSDEDTLKNALRNRG